jgi:hypothetical protein
MHFMGCIVSIVGKRNFRARSGRYAERESLVVVPVDSKRMIRDGTEIKEVAASVSKCRHNNHKIEPGKTFRVVMGHIFCENHYSVIPTLETVNYEFRPQLGYEVEINLI